MRSPGVVGLAVGQRLRPARSRVPAPPGAGPRARGARQGVEQVVDGGRLGAATVDVPDEDAVGGHLGFAHIVEAALVRGAKRPSEASAVPVADHGVERFHGGRGRGLQSDLDGKLVPGALGGDPDGEGEVALGPAEQGRRTSQGLEVGQGDNHGLVATWPPWPVVGSTRSTRTAA